MRRIQNRFDPTLFFFFLLFPFSFLLFFLLACDAPSPPSPAHAPLGRAVPGPIPLPSAAVSVFPDRPGTAFPLLAGFVYIDSVSVEPLRRIGAQLVLIDQIYDLVMPVIRRPDGILDAEFSALDGLLDRTRKSGARPVITLDFTPTALSPYPYLENSERRSVPPVSYTEWATLVEGTVRHVRQVRGADVACWSVWNEPNLAMFWNVDPRRYTRWIATAREPGLWTPAGVWQAAPGAFRDLARRIEYSALYETAARAIKRVDPVARVAGPNVSHFDPEWLSVFLNHCAEQELAVDFVTWHYPGYPDEMRRSMQWLKNWTTKQGIPTPPVLITEWVAKTPEGADAWTEVMETLDIAQGYADAGVAGALYYTAGKTHEVDGALTPIGRAFEMLGLLTGQRVETETSAGIRSMAVLDAKDRLALVFWTREAISDSVLLEIPDRRFGRCDITLFYADGKSVSQSFPTTSNGPPVLDLSHPGGCIGSVVWTP